MQYSNIIIIIIIIIISGITHNILVLLLGLVLKLLLV